MKPIERIAFLEKSSKQEKALIRKAKKTNSSKKIEALVDKEYEYKREIQELQNATFSFRNYEPSLYRFEDNDE